MGIVVTVFMLLGAWALSPWALPGPGAPRQRPRLWQGIGTGLLGAGLWNALWHGLRHLDQFWGLAALGSGLVMVLAALMVLARGVAAPAWLSRLAERTQALRPLVLLGLLLCFLLYAVTLVRLNLGYSIPG